MSIELLQTLSLVSYIVAAVLFLAAIALFFLLDIKKVFGDVTGATARKAIADIRQQNEASGDKAYKPSPVNAARGKLTDKISESGRLVPQFESMGGSPGTEKFDTAILNPGANETTVLTQDSQPGGETTVLSSEEQVMPDISPAPEASEFTVDVEMGFSGTSETIE